jgi:polysaccharide deacetylase 2 family uncharacterized protein YibQ
MPEVPALAAAAPGQGGAAPEAAAPAPLPRQTVSIITPGVPGQGMQVRTVELSAPARGPGGLALAPDERFVEKLGPLMLPRIAADGARPWRHYARPAPAADARPRVAVLVTGLGLNERATGEAVERLPAGVTLALNPYGLNLQAQADRARADGHEVMLQLPMEPFDFPANDPGPRALLTGVPAEANRDRLHWALGRFQGYTGLVNFMGAKLASNDGALRPVLAELRARGLAYVDDGASSRSLGPRIAREIGLAHATAAVQLDAELSPDRIDDALVELEQEAGRSGFALGVARLTPLSVDRIARWASELEARGFVLAPVSAGLAGERPDVPAPRS